jgi:hypothetical protein
MISRTTILLLLSTLIFFISCKKNKPVTPISDHYTDGEASKLIFNRQNGVNIVILGDGFTKDDLKKGGAYETRAKEMVDYLFTIPPYQQYKSFFNVYMVCAESKKSGLNKTYDPSGTDTQFNTYISNGGTGLLLTGNYEAVNTYVDKAIPYNKANVILLIVNTDSVDAATTTGNLAIITKSKLAKYAMIHEFGHALASLGDEYVAPEIADNYSPDLIQSYPNLDITNDPKKVKWADFLNRDAYKSIVGIYEGGFYRATGVYRPEDVSVMTYAVETQHYNAPSRLAIVKKIDEITGTPFNIDDFLKNDAGLIQPVFLPPLGYKRIGVGDFINIKRKN